MELRGRRPRGFAAEVGSQSVAMVELLGSGGGGFEATLPRSDQQRWMAAWGRPAALVGAGAMVVRLAARADSGVGCGGSTRRVWWGRGGSGASLIWGGCCLRCSCSEAWAVAPGSGCWRGSACRGLRCYSRCNVQMWAVAAGAVCGVSTMTHHAGMRIGWCLRRECRSLG